MYKKGFETFFPFLYWKKKRKKYLIVFSKNFYISRYLFYFFAFFIREIPSLRHFVVILLFFGGFFRCFFAGLSTGNDGNDQRHSLVELIMWEYSVIRNCNSFGEVLGKNFFLVKSILDVNSCFILILEFKWLFWGFVRKFFWLFVKFSICRYLTSPINKTFCACIQESCHIA